MDSIEQAHAHLLQDTSIQFKRPAKQVSVPPPVVPAEPWQSGDGSWLFWGVIAAVLVGTVLIAVRQTWPWRPAERTGRAPTPATARTDAAAKAMALPAGALPEADALAGAGRYGEAVHVLLLRGIGAIERRLPRALGPSLTSRDIAALAALPDPVRAAFGGIAERTERAVFARHELTRSDWEMCRGLYAGLTQAAPP